MLSTVLCRQEDEQDKISARLTDIRSIVIQTLAQKHRYIETLFTQTFEAFDEEGTYNFSLFYMLIVKMLVNTSGQKEKKLHTYTFPLLIGHTHFNDLSQIFLCYRLLISSRVLFLMVPIIYHIHVPHIG